MSTANRHSQGPSNSTEIPGTDRLALFVPQFIALPFRRCWCSRPSAGASDLGSAIPPGSRNRSGNRLQKSTIERRVVSMIFLTAGKSSQLMSRRPVLAQGKGHDSFLAKGCETINTQGGFGIPGRSGNMSGIKIGPSSVQGIRPFGPRSVRR
jgi:hypothetical protein